jgi:hypothetical protein
MSCFAGPLAPANAAAQQAGDKLTLRPAAGLSTITLYKAEAGDALRKVPAKTLDGTFEVLQASSTGWLKLKVGNDVAWVDSYDVEVQRSTSSCLAMGLTSVPDQNRTGLAQRCP